MDEVRVDLVNESGLSGRFTWCIDQSNWSFYTVFMQSTGCVVDVKAKFLCINQYIRL